MARRVLGERVHPVTGKRIEYVACDVIAGTARAAAPREVDAVRRVPFSEVRAYVPGGLYPRVTPPGELAPRCGQRIPR
jgi:8-oxo-dGTP diphosphatase